MRNAIWIPVLVLLALTVGITSLVSAEEEKEQEKEVKEKKPYAKAGFYIGLDLFYNTIGNDFDGESVLLAYGMVAVIPEVEGGCGFGISLGIRFTSKGKSIGGEGTVNRYLSFEANYVRSTHDVTWLGTKSKADYNTINLDFKFYFLGDRSIQPYLLLFGICFPWLVVENGSTAGDFVGDLTFDGMGFNLGCGLSYYLNPKLCIAGGIVYRFVWYSSIDTVTGTEQGTPVGGEYELEDSLYGGNLGLSIGLRFTF